MQQLKSPAAANPSLRGKHPAKNTQELKSRRALQAKGDAPAEPGLCGSSSRVVPEGLRHQQHQLKPASSVAAWVKFGCCSRRNLGGLNQR